MKARLVISLGALCLPVLAGDNWPQFRGPNAAGVSMNANLPDKWSAIENVAWKTDLPGRSWSSPIVWGDRVFLTAVVNSGEAEAPKKGLYFGGDRPEVPKSEHHWKVVCLDLANGRMQWEKIVQQGAPHTSIHLKNSYGAETPVTDGERVYALFGNVGVFAFSVEGREVWSKRLEPRKTRYGWGTAASPVLHSGRLFIVNDNEDRAELLALDVKTGKELWRADREEKSNWATPFIWENDRRTELITAGSGAVRSYDLEGKLLWSLRGMSGIAIPTPFGGDGLLFVSSGYVGDKLRPLYAIRPGASGDITLKPGESNNQFIAWSNPVGGPYNPSPLFYEGRLYVLYDRGLISCYDAKTGQVLYDRERLPEGLAFTASPWAAGGHIFCLNEDGVGYVLRAGDKFELLRTNKLGDDDMCMATPALAGDRLLIRTAARIYCLRTNGLQGMGNGNQFPGPGGDRKAIKETNGVDASISRAISQGRTGQFVAAKFASEKGGTLPLQVYIPKNLAKETRYPLLIFLHGAGELGDDNVSQLASFPREFVSLENQAKYPCYVIAPQCPKSDAWSSFPEYPANARSSAAPTVAIRLTIELVESLIAECNIDRSRVYVTGLSLGGEGAFDIASRRPDLFAAAVPVCGIADVEKVSSLSRVALWIFHGERDEINPVKYSRDIFQALKAKGATPKYTEYKDAGHDIWGRAYSEPGLIPWLFQQHR